MCTQTQFFLTFLKSSLIELHKTKKKKVNWTRYWAKKFSQKEIDDMQTSWKTKKTLLIPAENSTQHEHSSDPQHEKEPPQPDTITTEQTDQERKTKKISFKEKLKFTLLNHLPSNMDKEKGLVVVQKLIEDLEAAWAKKGKKGKN